MFGDKVANLIQSHKSIRKYTEDPIPASILEKILDSAQWAPSHHNVQAYSIVAVKNKDTKKKLSAICFSQEYVEKCPVFLVFCADFYRLHTACMMNSTNMEIDEIENLLIGAVDVALAAENVLITARSYGLGGVMIGGIRNNPNEVVELLELPPYTFPVIGMCLGFPDEDPWQKPRTPREIVIFEEKYNTDHTIENLEKYEEFSADYYIRRTNGRKNTGWTKQMAQYISKPRREFFTEFLNKQGFKAK